MRREARLIAVALLAVAGSSCTRIEYALRKIPFLSYMQSAPSFDPYEATRPAPPGAVPYESPAGSVMPAIEPLDAGLRAFATGPHGRNPFTVDSSFLALGRKMYERNCLPCHGVTGHGDGPIVQKDPKELKYPPVAANLTLPLTVERPDGYLYGMITVARSGIMPPYGPRTTFRERWAIVSYLRTLQGVAPAATGRTGGN